MPPTHTDEGLRAAQAIRARHPRDRRSSILSQHVDVEHATRVLAEGPERLGYLLKDRVTDLESFVAALRARRGGGSVLDPQVVSQLLGRRRRDASRSATLTEREREVLAVGRRGPHQQGRSASGLNLTERAVREARHLDLLQARAALRR